jgi:hypothetical protein
MLTKNIRKCLVAGLACALALPALAQTQTAPPANPDCPPAGAVPKPGEPLSKQLGESKGVICPPDVDPGIKVPPPESGAKMPVIPPPATEGGKKADPK